MYFCYVDESGDTAFLSTQNKNSMPVFVLGGLILKEANVASFTKKFVGIKKKYFPSLAEDLERPIDLIRKEIKGSGLRNPRSLKSHNKWTHTQRFLDELLNLVNSHDGKIIGRVYVKKADEDTSSVGMYTSALQYICTEFNAFLEEKDEKGVIIADSRSHQLDVQTSHSIFTQKFKYEGDEYPELVEMPVFGKSDNHSGLQVSDIICSALLFPFASHTYCLEYSAQLKNIHVQPCHEKLRLAFHRRVAGLQYRRVDPKDQNQKRKVGGVFLSNHLDHKPTHLFFQKPVTIDDKLEKLVTKFSGQGSRGIREVRGKRIISR